MNWIKTIEARRRSQYQAGQDYADALYAAGELPMVIMQRAVQERTRSVAYSDGMRDAAYRMESKELGVGDE